MHARYEHLFVATKGHCWYCGATAFAIDHIIPKSYYKKIGARVNNDPSNIHPSCQSCNGSKCDKSLEEFRQYKSVARKPHKFWGERVTPLELEQIEDVTGARELAMQQWLQRAQQQKRDYEDYMRELRTLPHPFYSACCALKHIEPTLMSYSVKLLKTNHKRVWERFEYKIQGLLEAVGYAGHIECRMPLTWVITCGCPQDFYKITVIEGVIKLFAARYRNLKDYDDPFVGWVEIHPHLMDYALKSEFKQDTFRHHEWERRVLLC